MATITAFHMHDAGTADTGTLPGGAQLAGTAAGSLALGAGSNYSADGSAGALLAFGTLKIPMTPGQNVLGWYRRFLSGTLSAQTIPAGTWTFSATLNNSNAAAFMYAWFLCVGVWRPSTGARVGTILDMTALPYTLGTLVSPSTSASVSTTTSGNAVTIQNGDVLYVEVYAHAVYNSTATTQSDFHYDGGGADEAILTPPAGLTTFDANNTGGVSTTGQAFTGLLCFGDNGAGTPVQVQVAIDWNNTGTFAYADGFQDISADVRGAQIARGRSLATDQFGTGMATLILRNESGKYSPYNAASSIYPKLTPGKPVQVRTVFRGNTVNQFTGFISEYDQATKLSAGQIQIQCVDGMELLRRFRTSLGVQASQRTDQLFATMLANAGWTRGTVINGFGRTLPLFFQLGGNTTNGALPGVSTLQALQTLAANELFPSSPWIDRSGRVVFDAQSYLNVAAILATLTSTEDNQLNARLTDLYDSVTVNYDGYQTSSNIATVYSEATVRPLAPGDNTFTVTLTTATTTAPLQPVATTDYTANLASDFTSTDETAQVTVTAFSSTTTSATLTLHNALGQNVYCKLTMRGTPVVTPNPEPSVTVNVAAPLITSQPLYLSADYVNDAGAVTTYATDRAAVLSSPRPRPVVSLAGKTDAWTNLILQGELEQQIALIDNAAPWLSNLIGRFFIQHIDLSLTPPHQGQPLAMARWQLFDAAQSTTTSIPYANTMGGRAAGMALPFLKIRR